MAVYSVVLTNLHHVYKYQAEGFTVGGGVIAFIQIHMANKTNEVRKFCLDFDLRRFDTILIDPEGNISIYIGSLQVDFRVEQCSIR